MERKITRHCWHTERSLSQQSSFRCQSSTGKEKMSWGKQQLVDHFYFFFFGSYWNTNHAELKKFYKLGWNWVWQLPRFSAITDFSTYYSAKQMIVQKLQQEKLNIPEHTQTVDSKIQVRTHITEKYKQIFLMSKHMCRW